LNDQWEVSILDAPETEHPAPKIAGSSMAGIFLADEAVFAEEDPAVDLGLE